MNQIHKAQSLTSSTRSSERPLTPEGAQAPAQILKLTPKFNTASGSGGSLSSPVTDTTVSPSETSSWGSLGLGRVMELEWRNM